MEIEGFRVLAFVLIFGSGLAGGLLPRRMEHMRLGERLFPLGSALAGGIFLGAGLMHMLPDAVEAFRATRPRVDFPLAYLLAAVGFALILLLEKGFFAGVDEGPASTDPSMSSVSPAVLTLALSVHSVLAGVALGAEQTLLGAAVLLIAVLAHKGSAAFALAVSFHRTKASTPLVTKIIVGFSLTTPLGMLLGSVLADWLGARSGRSFEAVFDSLAAGTFLYVASMDIIREEFFETTGARWIKMSLLAAGLGLMGVLALLL